jgi:hypothetical protein
MALDGIRWHMCRSFSKILITRWQESFLGSAYNTRTNVGRIVAKPWKKVDEETKSVLREIDWNDVIPRILVLTRAEMYKKRSYGLYPLSWKIPEDYVNEAIALFLVGKRVWKHKEVPFLHFLHGSVTSLISHDVEKSYKYLTRVRSSDEESIRQELSTSPRAVEEDVVTEELLKQLRKVLEEDFVCIAIVELVITSGVSKPRELAEELEVPISEIYNAKKRFRRILLEVKEELSAEKPASKERL